MRFILCLLFTILLSKITLSLDVTVPIKIYEPLSKTISTSIPGSSNITINKDDIEKYQDSPLHQILDIESGIKSRSIYGTNSSGSKTTLDIRGMGAQAKSNVLILVNGQRLNNIDMSEIDFPSIPLESIDRIEVFKGNAGTVLYGDGAIGGTINIITNPDFSNKSKNEIVVKKGSYDSNEFIWNGTHQFDNNSFSSYFNHTSTDGYREENQQIQNNFSSELKFKGNKGDHFFGVSYSEQIMSTPSDRSQDQLYSDRRGSDTPDDFINSDGVSIFYGSDYNINSNMDLFINSSFRLKDSYSDLQSTSYPSYNDTSLQNYQFTPRINYKGDLFESTYGLDIQYADYLSHRKESQNVTPLHVYDAWQATQSFYINNAIKASKKTTLGAGIRIQRNNIAIGDSLNTDAPDYSGWQTEHKTLSDNETNHGFTIGLDHALNKAITLYGRVGNGFRYPNIDDRIGGSGGTSLELETQTSRDYEIGTKLLYDNFSSNISTYLIDGKNELAYDSDAFENINMNSTRRYGVELFTKNRINEKISFINNFTYAKAKYTSGDQGTYATNFEGKDVPLVPEYSLNSSLEWQLSDFISFLPSIKYQDDMRMESDDENFQETKIPNYFITNMVINTKFDKYFSSLTINNIFNKEYHNYAVASSSTKGTYNAYPEPGREILVSFGTKF